MVSKKNAGVFKGVGVGLELAGAASGSCERFDVVIVGCGSSGLYTALNLPVEMSVLVLTKTEAKRCDSMLAQGGICVLLDEDDYDSFYEDTMRAGHYENRPESVDIMIRSSRAVIESLIDLGVAFERTPEGDLAYTREGGHTRARICYHADTTGQEITQALLSAVEELSNAEIREHTCVVDLVEEDGACAGVVVEGENGVRSVVRSSFVVFATGGIGGLYEHSTNYPEITGDACRIARDRGIELEHMDYVQIHPTSLYTGRPGRAFLISESARGEGAVLLNAAGERFTDELQPRDVVSAAIFSMMEEEGSDHVWLSFAPVPEKAVTEHFKAIREECAKEGYDILKEPIPVVPAQHYFMGGIRVDAWSRTSMPHLFAVGETSCNGVHGKNRLASNSLLEALVFAQRAAKEIEKEADGLQETIGADGPQRAREASESRIGRNG